MSPTAFVVIALAILVAFVSVLMLGVLWYSQRVRQRYLRTSDRLDAIQRSAPDTAHAR
jgi:hypothetical protein